MSSNENREDTLSSEEADAAVQPWAKLDWEQFVAINQDLTGIQQALMLRYTTAVSIEGEWSERGLYLCVSSEGLPEVRGLIHASESGKVDFKQLPGKLSSLIVGLLVMLGFAGLLYWSDGFSWIGLAVLGFFAVKMCWNHFDPPSFELKVMNCLFDGPINVMQPFDLENPEASLTEQATTLEKKGMKFNRHWQKYGCLWFLLFLVVGLLVVAVIHYS